MLSKQSIKLLSKQ